MKDGSGELFTTMIQPDRTVILTGSSQAVILLASAAAGSLNICILSLLSSCLLHGREVSVLQSTWPSLMLPFQEELGVEDRVVTQVSLQDVSCVFLTRVLESGQKLSPPQCGNDSGLTFQ